MDSRMSVIARRAKTVTGVAAAFFVVLLTLPITVPVAAVVDLARGRPRFPRVRMLLMGLVYLGWEMKGVLTATGWWIGAGFGAGRHRTTYIEKHRSMQMKWMNSLRSSAERIVDLDLQVKGSECLADGPVILLARHASIVDTLIPGLIVDGEGMKNRYVMKRELLLDPAIDLFATRFPNYFVDRSGRDTQGELDAIEAFAAGSDPDEVVVIFPEGTRWTEEKRAKAQRSLEQSNPPRAAEFAERTDTMPPRGGGTLAALAGLPDADIVILAYTGLEGLTGPVDAAEVIPFREPVIVNLRRIPRSEVPTDPQDQRAWLDEEWKDVDEWVRTHRVT